VGLEAAVNAKPQWAGLAQRQVVFDWDDPETGERYEVAARALYCGDLGGPNLACDGPNVQIIHVRDFHGREVAGELFGTFLSIAIRGVAASLLEARPE
jgi:hypothetical protein